jgi:methylenetetrahydrofolate dehydrogenase (NADP+)/methenyltetrahydrofolate cyclohydrolase
MLLYGKTLAQEIKQQLITQRQQVFGNQKVYVAELFFGENPSIQVYVNLKVKYAEAIGMECKVFGQEKERNYEEVLLLIKKLNADPQCVGIICQQPLPAHLEPYKEEMCLAVHPLKDIDGLGGIINGRNQI